MEISYELHTNSIHEINLKIKLLKLPQHLPGSNELMSLVWSFLKLASTSSYVHRPHSRQVSVSDLTVL